MHATLNRWSNTLLRVVFVAAHIPAMVWLAIQAWRARQPILFPVGC